jgi:arylsulfatase B
VFEKPVISLDVFSTALSLAGIAAKKDRVYDGVDLIPYLKGEKDSAPHEQLYWRSGKRTAFRSGDWKILQNPRRGKNGAWELYNLANDLSESNDLSHNYPDKLRELISQWQQLNSQMIEPIWSPRR